MKHLKSIIPAIAFLMLAMTNVSYAHGTKATVVDKSPYLFYSTKATGRLSQNKCLNRAKKALTRSDVRVIHGGHTTIIGSNGRYKGIIICSSIKRQAMIIVTGGSRAKTAALRTKIKQNFRR